MWYTPKIYNNIGFEVSVISDPDLIQNCCEYNCDSYIKQYGRKGYDANGVLLNNCEVLL
jgi:hypothetical protein